MWVDDRLVFVSDRAAEFPNRADEQANLWVWDEPGTAEPHQLTHQRVEQGYVRDATTDGHRVTWHSRGRLTALAPDHGGDARLVVSQGAAFWLSHREGPARALVADSAVRAREVALLGRTGSAVLVTDAEGEDVLEVHDLTGTESPRRLAAGELGRVLHLASDMAGTRVATIAHDGRIHLVNLSSGTVEEVGMSPQGEADSLGFSPDGRYLLWSQPTYEEAELHQLVLLDTAAMGSAGQPVALTSGTFHDHDPAFTHDGNYVVFLSARTFDPAYDNHEFALSFAGSTRPWLLPLSATEAAPFGPSATGWRISKAAEEQDSSGDEAVWCPDLDHEGAEQRIVPFPVPSADYRELRVAKDGVLWIKEDGGAGELGARRSGLSDDCDPDTLEFWSFPQRRVQTVADKVTSYAVSGDGERVVVRHEDTVTVSPATTSLRRTTTTSSPSTSLGCGWRWKRGRSGARCSTTTPDSCERTTGGRT